MKRFICTVCGYIHEGDRSKYINKIYCNWSY